MGRALFAFAVIAAVCVPRTAWAQFHSTREERALCRGDAHRLCSAHMPSPRAVRTCMIANAARLSPGCRRVVEGRS